MSAHFHFGWVKHINFSSMDEEWVSVLLHLVPNPIQLNRQFRRVCQSWAKWLKRDDVWRDIFGGSSAWTRALLSHWAGYQAWLWGVALQSHYPSWKPVCVSERLNLHLIPKCSQRPFRDVRPMIVEEMPCEPDTPLWRRFVVILIPKQIWSEFIPRRIVLSLFHLWRLGFQEPVQADDSFEVSSHVDLSLFSIVIEICHSASRRQLVITLSEFKSPLIKIRFQTDSSSPQEFSQNFFPFPVADPTFCDCPFVLVRENRFHNMMHSPDFLHDLFTSHLFVPPTSGSDPLSFQRRTSKNFTRTDVPVHASSPVCPSMFFLTLPLKDLPPLLLQCHELRPQQNSPQLLLRSSNQLSQDDDEDDPICWIQKNLKVGSVVVPMWIDTHSLIIFLFPNNDSWLRGPFKSLIITLTPIDQ